MDDSGSNDEFSELADDLDRVIGGKSFKKRRYKKKSKTAEVEETPGTPIIEEPIIAAEFIPLGDEEIAKTGKGLLNARVIFVMGG